MIRRILRIFGTRLLHFCFVEFLSFPKNVPVFPWLIWDNLVGAKLGMMVSEAIDIALVPKIINMKTYWMFGKFNLKYEFSMNLNFRRSFLPFQSFKLEVDINLQTPTVLFRHIFRFPF